MNTNDIKKKYGIDCEEFNNFLKKYNLEYSTTLFSDIIVDDSLIDSYVDLFWDIKEETHKKMLDMQIENEKKRKAMSKMLITSGFDFDGYRIVKYSGYISGDDAISINRGTHGLFSDATNVSDSLTKSLVKIRRKAIEELKEAAYDLGCNAVIGVDFDYITLEPETASGTGGTVYLPYVFCVTANGNAVIIEKMEE